MLRLFQLFPQVAKRWSHGAHLSNNVDLYPGHTWSIAKYPVLSEDRYTFIKLPVILWLQGAGTDDNTLIRVMVTRSEVDLMNIRTEFRKLFACSLFSMIKVRKHTNRIYKPPARYTKLLNISVILLWSFLCSLFLCVCYREIPVATTERLYYCSVVAMMSNRGNKQDNRDHAWSASSLRVQSDVMFLCVRDGPSGLCKILLLIMSFKCS